MEAGHQWAYCKFSGPNQPVFKTFVHLDFCDGRFDLEPFSPRAFVPHRSGLELGRAMPALERSVA